MKFPALLILPAMLAACASPQQKIVNHQDQLAKEAAENFALERQKHREETGYVPPVRRAPTVAAPETAGAPKVATQEAPPKRHFIPTFKIAKATPPPPAQMKRRAVVDDTIYEPTAEGRAQQRAYEQQREQEYRAFEASEARLLGKRPDQLTRDERAWIRSRFR